MGKPNVLYISYDGMLEPLGQSQVIRYIERLSKSNDFVLVSYEKPIDLKNYQNISKLKKYLIKKNIKWLPLKYHKTPTGIATAYDIVIGILVCSYITIKYNVRLVHARSYVPSVIALILKKIFTIKYIFDMRGFWADERVDGDLWPKNGRLYRLAKWFEKMFLLNADYVIALTNIAVTEIKIFPYLRNNVPKIKVITTCADLNLFKRRSEFITKTSKKNFTLGYVGSVGVWYLFEEVLDCFKELLKQIPAAKLYILNRGGHEYIYNKLNAAGINLCHVVIKATNNVGVANAMQFMDAGIFLIKPVYSKLASAPTKMGEFLGCGVPCLSNTHVGDVANILEGHNVGVALHTFDDTSIKNGIDKLISLSKEKDIHQRCRKVAVELFSLNDGVNKYNEVYQELSETQP